MANPDITELKTLDLLNELKKRIGIKVIQVDSETEYNVIVNPIGKTIWDPAIRTDEGEDPKGPATILII
jgi:hypothetical protein